MVAPRTRAKLGTGQARRSCFVMNSVFIGLAYDGGTTALGAVRLGSTPSSPKLWAEFITKGDA